jgi:hypothetical protein
MDNLQLKQAPVMRRAMLIRKPAADVFEAFVNPKITTRFSLTKSSGRLEADKQVQWDWEMYDISTAVTVKAIELNKRIVIGGEDIMVSPQWNGYSSLNRMARHSSGLRSRLQWRWGPTCEAAN